MNRVVSGFALSMSLVLVLLVGAALLIGLRQPPSDWAALFRLDDCQLPCWVGIEPGNSTVTDAERSIERAFGDDRLYSLEKYGIGGYDITYKPSEFALRTGFVAQNGGQGASEPVITVIYLMPHTTTDSYGARPGIAELYHGLGAVEGLQRVIGWEASQLNLFFKARLVDVFLDEPSCDKVRLNQGIFSISISAQPSSSNVSVQSPPSSWRGFNTCHNLELRLKYP